MKLPDFLIQDADGAVRLVGHRIELGQIVHHYNEGYSAEMLACQYPSVPLAAIHKTIAYYLENREAVDLEAASCQAELDRQRGQGRHLDATALRQRLETARQLPASTGRP